MNKRDILSLAKKINAVNAPKSIPDKESPNILKSKLTQLKRFLTNPSNIIYVVKNPITE
jgi:hypothetical protein